MKSTVNMFPKTLFGFVIAAASVRVSRGNVLASELNTSYTFVRQNGTQPFNVPDGQVATISRRRLIPVNSKIITIKSF